MSESLKKGRNILLTDKSYGHNYLSKKLVGEYNDKKRRANNIVAWNSLLPLKKINSPKLINIDLDDFIVKHEFINNANSLENVLIKNFSNNKRFFYDAISILCEIHSITNKNINIQSTKDIKRNSPLEIMSIDDYQNCSGGELELFSLLQHDELLIKALSTNYTNEISPIHGDVRLDQFLVDSTQNLWVVDFEEFCYGDITKDIAGLMGSLIFNSLIDVFSTSVPDLFEEEDINSDILHRGEEELDKLIPTLKKSIIIYQETRNLEINLKTLSINLGWFLIERVISRSKLTFKLSEIDKAIAGIGRQAIIFPETFVSLLTN